MRVINLGSGSKGNATLIEDKNISILIDAGLTMKAINERLKMAGSDLKYITAILISHNHIDHVRAVAQISDKYNIPVYAPRECFLDPNLAKINQLNKFEIGLDDFRIGDILISTFELPHDALKTIGFIFFADGNKVSLLTDVGRVDELMINKIAGSNLVLIESNYDEEMLMNGPYPYPLKRRISSNMGHLSNFESSKIITKLAKLGTSYFMLMHLSEINNTPQVAFNTVMNMLYDELGQDNQIKILMSSQYGLSPNFVFKTRGE